MKTIPLTQGQVAYVDDEDYTTIVSKGNWTYLNGYAIRFMGRGPRGTLLEWMHHLVLAPVEGLQIDHIDGKGTNNRRSNLRYVTASQNQANRGPQKNNTSGYKGVIFMPLVGNYQARITVKGKRIYLGVFKTAQQAALAYNKASLEHFGQFGYQNPL